MADEDDLGVWQNEIFALRDTQETAEPTQPLDSTTIFSAEITRVRNLDAVLTPMDTNTELRRRWDGVR